MFNKKFIKRIPSKLSVPRIKPGIRKKIRRKNATHAKASKTGSAKIDPNVKLYGEKLKLTLGCRMVFL